MSHYKLQPMKSKTFYRLIPTLLFIVAITTIVLTMFFMFVLQSRNAYELDGDDPFSIANDDFKMEIDGATSDQNANLDIDDIIFENNINTFTSTQKPTTKPTPPHYAYETFLLTQTINPATTSNHIQTNNNNLQSMKAYKIVSKKPIIENSLVKIVMAPHNVLEKLSSQDRRNDVKCRRPIDTIDKSGNAPIKEEQHRRSSEEDDIYGRELIPNGNVNVEVFSLEDEGHIDSVKTTPHTPSTSNVLLHHDFDNIQIIANSHKQPPNELSMRHKILAELQRKEKIGNIPNKNEIKGMSSLQSVEVDTKPMENISVDSESTYTKLPVTTEPIMVDSKFTVVEELLSNPTTSQNLIPTLVPEHQTKSMEIPTDTNEATQRIGLQDVGHLPITSLDVSTEDNTPMFVMKILKNRTVLIEETLPQSTTDQMVMETATISKTETPVTRPKKKTGAGASTTTSAPTTAIEVKQPQFPKKTTSANSFNKHKKVVPKLDDVSFELSSEANLLHIESTEVPSQSSIKSKATKRAVGNEGTFASNIVRPSPIRPTKIGDLFPRETNEERAQRLSKSMQRLMHFVTIAGHVDSYLTKRVRNGLRNVARIFDSVEETRRRRSNFTL